MNQNPPPLPRKRKKLGIKLLIVFGIFVGTSLVVGLTLFSIWRWHLRNSVNAQVAAIRASGLPLNWDDLAKWPKEIPDDANVARLYTEAFAQIAEKAIPDSRNMPRRGEAISEETMVQLEMAVRSNTQAIAIASGITNAHSSRYPINFDDGPGAQLLHLKGLKLLALALECKAVIDSARSDSRRRPQTG